MSARLRNRLQLPAAVASIRQHGALLVFPINNRELPHSLWAEFFPKTRMVWDWNDDSDARRDMWQMMKRLSDCREVVYSKWYQGRATFFSHEFFAAMLSDVVHIKCLGTSYPETARVLFEVLENNSPLSTKELKELTDLQGRVNESMYNRGMKELFTRLLIVGFGEVEDGAFPSLAVGATELLFEEQWRHGSRSVLIQGRVHTGTFHARPALTSGVISTKLTLLDIHPEKIDELERFNARRVGTKDRRSSCRMAQDRESIHPS